MATHSSVLACRIPGTAEPGELPAKSQTGLSNYTFTFTGGPGLDVSCELNKGIFTYRSLHGRQDYQYG